MGKSKNKNNFEFIIKVDHEKIKKFLDKLEKKNILHGLITEWGAVIPENCRIIVELGEKTDDNWIATKGFIQESEDEVFVRLMKDGKKTKMPKFEDVFEIKEL